MSISRDFLAPSGPTLGAGSHSHLAGTPIRRVDVILTTNPCRSHEVVRPTALSRRMSHQDVARACSSCSLDANHLRPSSPLGLNLSSRMRGAGSSADCGRGDRGRTRSVRSGARHSHPGASRPRQRACSRALRMRIGARSATMAVEPMALTARWMSGVRPWAAQTDGRAQVVEARRSDGVPQPQPRSERKRCCLGSTLDTDRITIGYGTAPPRHSPATFRRPFNNRGRPCIRSAISCYLHSACRNPDPDARHNAPEQPLATPHVPKSTRPPQVPSDSRSAGLGLRPGGRLDPPPNAGHRTLARHPRPRRHPHLPEPARSRPGRTRPRRSPHLSAERTAQAGRNRVLPSRHRRRSSNMHVTDSAWGAWCQ